jgi:hypothetical protein
MSNPWYAIIAFLVAIVLGALRCNWIGKHAETEISPATFGPYGGWIILLRVVSWLAVAILSIYSAFVFSLWLDRFLPNLLAGFLFGVILVIRWLVSSLIGTWNTNSGSR